MANLEYELTYNPPQGNSLLTFFIVWGVLGVILALFLAHILMPSLSHGGIFVQYAHWLTWSILLGVAYTIVPYVVFASCSQAKKLQVTRRGLGLPSSVGLIPGFRRWQPWSQLQALSMSTNTPLSIVDTDYLSLKFKDAPEVKLYLNGFRRQDLSHLLLSLEVLVAPGVRQPSLNFFQDALQNTSAGELTYTRIWEEELGRRFHSTTFIPMGPGQSLAEARLTIVRQIAFGGSSAVYLARDRFAQEVVVKESVVGADAIDGLSKRAAEFFEREAKLLMLLNHPAIARVLDHFIENGRHYLVLQYIPGITLRQLVRKTGPMPERRVLELAQQMAEILQYLHTHNPVVMHRDFTPDNLVLQPNGQLTLIDFGAASEFIGTATGTLIGKQSYMPPEQVRGKTCPLSDLYAFGCTLNFLLTGVDGEALTQLHPRQYNASLSLGTDELVAKLTEQNKDKRLKSAQLVGLALEAVLDDLPEAALVEKAESVTLQTDGEKVLVDGQKGSLL